MMVGDEPPTVQLGAETADLPCLQLGADTANVRKPTHTPPPLVMGADEVSFREQQRLTGAAGLAGEFGNHGPTLRSLQKPGSMGGMGMSRLGRPPSRELARPGSRGSSRGGGEGARPLTAPEAAAAAAHGTEGGLGYGRLSASALSEVVVLRRSTDGNDGVRLQSTACSFGARSQSERRPASQAGGGRASSNSFVRQGAVVSLELSSAGQPALGRKLRQQSDLMRGTSTTGLKNRLAQMRQMLDEARRRIKVWRAAQKRKPSRPRPLVRTVRTRAHHADSTAVIAGRYS
eukprot:SAG11_NODE_814_length_7033_cov_57.557254_9_plen_289_part_00